jgi:hypothetical protein
MKHIKLFNQLNEELDITTRKSAFDKMLGSREDFTRKLRTQQRETLVNQLSGESEGYKKDLENYLNEGGSEFGNWLKETYGHEKLEIIVKNASINPEIGNSGSDQRREPHCQLIFSGPEEKVFGIWVFKDMTEFFTYVELGGHGGKVWSGAMHVSKVGRSEIIPELEADRVFSMKLKRLVTSIQQNDIYKTEPMPTNTEPMPTNTEERSFLGRILGF